MTKFEMLMQKSQIGNASVLSKKQLETEKKLKALFQKAQPNEKRIIFGKQLQKRMKQKDIWDNEHNKPDLERLFILMHPDKITEVDRNTKEPKYIHSKTRAIRTWTDGQIIPDIETIVKLCNILDCDIRYLFTENAEMPNRDIDYLCQTYNINRESSENLLAITKDKAAVEMLNIILGNKESLLDFLQNLYDIKNNRDIDKRIMISKDHSESKVIDLEEVEKETGETIPLKYGISIKDAIKGYALNNINRIIDQWTERKEGD